MELPLRVVEVPERSRYRSEDVPGWIRGATEAEGRSGWMGGVRIADDGGRPPSGWKRWSRRSGARRRAGIAGPPDAERDDGGRTTPPVADPRTAAPIPVASLPAVHLDVGVQFRTSVLRAVGAWHDTFHAQDRDSPGARGSAGFDLAITPSCGRCRERDRAEPVGIH